MTALSSLVLTVLFFAVFFYVLYFVVRAAVRGGLRDNDEERRNAQYAHQPAGPGSERR
ncbi:hypothetical protein [Zhihengliuella halotolerans]|uniref:Uncharacterized protein n=1 Tax=Zhihengliuella halotolerans TaxID=370736 RepID=A0A4Q8AG19_9MICC|nr:hypothetical protein [Zhihengliuella halotolerans]RZU63204.1 hypothetical protein EV380_2816 [Zhihengliuella halotolerans]